MNQSPFKRCIVFLTDGARPDVLNEECQKGNLPNISRYLMENGTNETMVSVFPSTTGPAYLPFLTGCYPGTCNVPGIRWFDKDNYAEKGWSLKSFRSYVGLETFLMNRDMRSQFKTAFELFDNPVSILNMVNRGIHRGHNKTRFSRIWYVYYAHLTDHWSFVDEASCNKLLSALDEDPDFAFCVFPGVDEYSHRSSPFNKRTRECYAEIDGLVGKVADKLRQKGWLEETLMIMVADHGLSETRRHFDIGPYLETKGIPTFFYPRIFDFSFDAASMVSGNGMAHLYFKGEQGWKGRLSHEEISKKSLLLDELRLRPEVDLVASVGEDHSIHLQNDRGHGVYSIKNGQVHYQWRHQEPLGLDLPPSLGSQLTLSEDEAANLSFHSHFPDVFNQLRQVFTSPRTGDVIVSARSGSDLRERYEHPEHKSSHGSLCPEHMKIPFLMNYPIKFQSPPEKNSKQSLKPVKTLRSVDVFPTLLELLGKEIPEGVDGQSLV